MICKFEELPTIIQKHYDQAKVKGVNCHLSKTTSQVEYLVKVGRKTDRWFLQGSLWELEPPATLPPKM